MLIPKEDRKLIHQYLFKEGVMVAPKDFNLNKHPHINVRNLYVIKAMQSLTSRGYVKTQFSWQWFYYTLTPTGLEFLRDWLHVPSGYLPQTHIKNQRPSAQPRGYSGGAHGDERDRDQATRRGMGGAGRGAGPRPDRDAY